MLVKQLFDSVDFEHIPHIKEFCEKEKCHCSFLKNTAELLTARLKDNLQIKAIKSKIYKVEDMIDGSPEIKTHLSMNLLVAMSFFAVKDNGKQLAAFVNWVKGNRLYQLHNIDPQSMIKLFEQIYSNEINVFVAMPYYDDSTVGDYNDSIKKVCSDLSAESGLNIIYSSLCE